MTTYFISGTDTDAGKSLITAACLYGLNQQGVRTLGYKPVAAGASQSADGLINEDAKLLARYSVGQLSAVEINPICFEPAIAPHIAAQKTGQSIDSAKILKHFSALNSKVQPDVSLVEGAGGWKVPLDLAGHTLADLPKQERWPVVLVVGMKLGCLNHALLTADAMISDGLGLVGWVANCIDPDMEEVEANIDSLRSLLAIPCIGVVPHLSEATAENAWNHIQPGVTELVQRYKLKGW